MISDREILRLRESNEEFAFRSLYADYAPLVYGWIRNLTDDIYIACNVLEKSFIDIWCNIDLYNPGKTTLFTWMIQITAKNCQPLQVTLKAASQQLKAMRYKTIELR